MILVDYLFNILKYKLCNENNTNHWQNIQKQLKIEHK